MKMQKSLLAAAVFCCFLLIAGCSEKSQQEDYTGTWAQEEFGWIYGGMVMDISKIQDTLNVKLIQYKPAPYTGAQTFTTKFVEDDMEDGFISVAFEGEDYGGYAGILELQFSNDRVYCEIKDLTYTDEESSFVALFYEGTTTLIRMDDAHERMEYTDEEYDAWYNETFLGEQAQEEEVVQDNAGSASAAKSGQEIVAALRNTADFTWDWYYDSAYTDKSDTIVVDGWTYERVTYPGITSMLDFIELSLQYYTGDVAEELFYHKEWEERGGSLYISQPDGIGDMGIATLDVDITQDSDTCYTLTLYENYTYKIFLEEDAYKVHYEYVNGYWVFDTVILLDELTEIRLIE